VVQTVIVRRVEPGIEPGKAPDGLGVTPELRDRIELDEQEDLERREAGEDDRDIEKILDAGFDPA
jgi:hypothetical protein